MSYNRILETTLDRSYNNTYNVKEYKIPDIEHSFSRTLDIDISKSEVEIPLFVYYEIELQLLSSGYHIEDCTNIVYHIGICDKAVSKNSIISALKTCFYATPYSGLIKIKCKTGEILYMNRGIILDSNFNVLFLISINSSKTVSCGLYDIDCKGINIYINPIVFLTKTSITKAIIKNMLPFYLENKIYNIGNPRNSNYYHRDGILAKVFIEDKSDIFICPKITNTDNDIDRHLNNMIKDSLNNSV